VEQFILDELRGKNTNITGPGSGDAKAIRVGQSILRAFKPKLLGITLQNHDVAHSSYNSYVEVIRRNDAEIGQLWSAIQQDQDLRETTTVMICPEFGRDKNLNQRNGLDHGDGSDELRKVFLIAAGPDFKSNTIIHTDIRPPIPRRSRDRLCQQVLLDAVSFPHFLVSAAGATLRESIAHKLSLPGQAASVKRVLLQQAVHEFIRVLDPPAAPEQRLRPGQFKQRILMRRVLGQDGLQVRSCLLQAPLLQPQ
jgi:hypothetical protein